MCQLDALCTQNFKIRNPKDTFHLRFNYDLENESCILSEYRKTNVILDQRKLLHTQKFQIWNPKGSFHTTCGLERFNIDFCLANFVVD
jgi:hypothetical protein